MSSMNTGAPKGGPRADLLPGSISANTTKYGASQQRYPHIPGHKGRSNTGVDGAGQIGRRAQTVRLATLSQLSDSPVTAEQIAGAIDEHFMIVRARCSELRAQGLIEDTGQRGAGALGGKVIVWRLTTSEERAIFAARKAAEAEHGEGAKP